MRKEIVTFQPSDELYAQATALYENERAKLSILFPTAQIEHVGSTSVSGTLTKGDVDVNLRVVGEEFEVTVAKLKELYEINQFHNWTNTYASFKDDSRGLGIQLTVLGGPEDVFVAHREYFILHPELVEEYNALKSRLEGRDMEEYRDEKAKFFDRVAALIRA